ncbi:MAG: lysophospholipid acyltransferase (LPLAT)-like uncharacterized protein [Halieaceae bacterium]|jgi:lysophospholipid acyltransferase (LPLAT)-like uncharacterized protein
MRRLSRFILKPAVNGVLNSGDNHRFPKPFSIIYIGFGKPVAADRVLFKQDPELAAKHVQQAMMDNVNKLKVAARS